jgi:MFS family permease
VRWLTWASPMGFRRAADDSGRRRRHADGVILCAACFARAIAVGATGVLLGLYLARLGLGEIGLGGVLSAGLAGAGCATLVVTAARGRLRARPALMTLALLSGAGMLATAFASSAPALALASFVGMLNGMGRDRGASLVLETALLPSTVGEERRTLTFAWYHVLQDAGHALGAVLAMLPALLRRRFLVEELVSMRLTLLACALLSLVPAALYLFLSRQVEPPAGRRPRRVSPESRRILWRISGLFAADSLAGGLLTTALLSYFFFERFGVEEAGLGALFLGARILNALSHFAAAWLARRIGLVNTMVFTHIPSSLLLATALLAPSFPVAAVLFLLREGLVEMDVPTRQSYLMAVVRPEERVLASGVTHLVRLGGWAIGPLAAGIIMKGAPLAAPFLAGAGLKVAYDLLLYAAFRRIKPPEEQGG